MSLSICIEKESSSNKCLEKTLEEVYKERVASLGSLEKNNFLKPGVLNFWLWPIIYVPLVFG